MVGLFVLVLTKRHWSLSSSLLGDHSSPAHMLSSQPCFWSTPPFTGEVVHETFTRSSFFPLQICSFMIHALYTSAFHILVIHKTTPHHLTASSEIFGFVLNSPQTPPIQIPAAPSSSVGPPVVSLCHFFVFAPILITPFLLLFLLRCLGLRGCVSHAGELVCLLTGVCLLVIWGDNDASEVDGHERSAGTVKAVKDIRSSKLVLLLILVDSDCFCFISSW